MRSIDVPNGILFEGARGRAALVDLDEKGGMSDIMEELSGEDGSPHAGRGSNSLRFVHTVKGEESMLVRDLFSVSLMERVGEKERPVKVVDLMRRGKLAAVVREAHKEWVRRRSDEERGEKES